MRVACIDIGTNSVLLLVADVAPGEEPRALEEHATITRLGEGVDRTRALAEGAVSRTLACLERYATIVRDAGVARLAVVGTSAMRDAAGGEAFRRRAEEICGVPPRVISGDEEARLTFSGALSGLEAGAAGDSIVVFDVGGGSTEVVQGAERTEASIRYAESFDVGSVRLTERHLHHDPPTAAELRAVEEDVRHALAEVPSQVRAREPVGIAGTVTTLAAVGMGLSTYDGARVHGHRMTKGELSAVVERLSRLPLAERRQVTGMEPKRADVIVAGGVLTLTLLEVLGAEGVRVSDRGVRWGLALRLAAT